MAKQLNTVNLTFNADTGKARQQLQELQTMLDKLVKGSIASSSKSQLPLTKELTEAQVAASKLQTILKQTTNAIVKLYKCQDINLCNFYKNFA